MENKDLLHKFVQYPTSDGISYVYDVDESLGQYPLAILYIGEREGKPHSHMDVWPSVDYVRVNTGEDYIIVDKSDVTYAEKRSLIEAVFKEL